ncbi:hypothetical protein [Nonomuraea dietziae]|uniref:hypothetical protein n=1 Tax=Nonomuraea dietziae TaxID=65515 RepID=UPI0031D7EE71
MSLSQWALVRESTSTVKPSSPASTAVSISCFMSASCQSPDRTPRGIGRSRSRPP